MSHAVDHGPESDVTGVPREPDYLAGISPDAAIPTDQKLVFVSPEAHEDPAMMAEAAAIAPPGKRRFAGRAQRQGQTAASATMLLMASSLLSGLLGLLRIKYMNFLFGAGVAQDAYRAAFTLPDLINYFLIGGAASISVVTILNRYRERGDQAGEDHALSVILSTMTVVLVGGILLAELFAPMLVRLFVDANFFHDARGPLCIEMTRWLLPGQLFIFLGSALSARLQVRKIFVYNALSPLIYNVGIVSGAFFLHRQIGVRSLVAGVLAGAILGPATVNACGALRTGFRFTPRPSFTDPAFREWFRLSLPLMLGVSLVMFDGVFFNRFASGAVGDLTRIKNAKDLFNAPFSVLGPAAGLASLPFFASLYQQGKMWAFSDSVGRAVSRLFAVGMLVSAWMIALAPWLLDLLRGGRLSRADAAETATLFSVLALTLAVWAVQGIYARAFYAASNTVTPAVAGTTIVLLSLPLYWALHRSFGLMGLVVASDIGIVAQTVSLAILLHRQRLVSLLHLEFSELGKAFLAAVFAGWATWFLVRRLPHVQSHSGDLLVVSGGSIAWLAAAAVVLLLLRSKLPRQVLRRR